MLRLCNCLRALLRIRRSADFVFGIKSIKLERGTLSERQELSTGVLGLIGAGSAKPLQLYGIWAALSDPREDRGNF